MQKFIEWLKIKEANDQQDNDDSWKDAITSSPSWIAHNTKGSIERDKLAYAINKTRKTYGNKNARAMFGQNRLKGTRSNQWKPRYPGDLPKDINQ
jgi:hypothetical protein